MFQPVIKLYFKLTIVAFSVAASLMFPSAATPREIYGLSDRDLGLYAGNRLLFEWRVAEARALLDGLQAGASRDAAFRSLESQVLFFEGRYGAALDAVRNADASGPFADLVAATAAATDGMSSRQSEHFRLYWKDPKDEILVEPALATLETARRILGERLGFKPDETVRVEIYPDVASFTAVSTLTRDEVRTSGTIGLCKFNRIMMTSPRATLWGFSWRDTLVHEYLHLVIYRLSRGRAPIWVHEGIAKSLEGSWRGETEILDPSSQALLARRLQSDSLIPLEKMSPSVAKLPSAEDTKLAFAQVATLFRFLEEGVGSGAVNHLLALLGEGLSDREALGQIWEGGLPAFQAAWDVWIRSQTLDGDAGDIIALQLKEEGSGDEPGHIPDAGAADFVRLGELLRDRDRPTAASAEYTKAYERSATSSGVISRHLWGLLATDRSREAADAARRGIALYPELPVLWYRKAAAHLRLEEFDDAAEAFRSLMDLNPFHIPGRRGLLACAEHNGDSETARRQRWALGLLEETPHETNRAGVKP